MVAYTRSAFFDTNVIVYLFDTDERRPLAEKVVSAGGIVSVQVLNEFVAVNRQKHKRSYEWMTNSLRSIRQLCAVEPLTLAQHELALEVAQRYGFQIYDATIIASALLAGCDTLYSEDMQHGQRIEGQLRVVNPFV